jgi:glutamate/tyrosine decarboxylase-like PLP-dependent enzyme
MMIHRRTFLGGVAVGLGGSATGILAAGCRPARPSPHLPVELAPLAHLPDQKNLLLGYPVNMASPPEEFFAWRRELARVGIDQFAFNNVGNPFEHSHVPFNSHPLERELVMRFAALYRFPAADTWGFLSNSGTDSNMQGLYMGRTILEQRAGTRPKIYFTAEAHYSIEILADLLGLERIYVDTHDDGRMDEAALGERLAEHPDHPALVVATLGTTFKGAIDSIDAIQARLSGRESYLHVDAALFGGYMPHTEFADELAQRAGADNRKRYDSIAVSCHKFFGFVSPAGIFVCTRANFEEFLERFCQVHNPEYLLQVPGTIMCSRDAVKPAEFLFYSTKEAVERQRADASQILRDTTYLFEQMKTHFPALNPVRANSLSNTIYFAQPSNAVVSTYSLATMALAHEGQRIPHAHVVVMPHATREILDRFLSDLDR